MQDPDNRLNAFPGSGGMAGMPGMPGMPGMGSKQKRQDPSSLVIDLEWLAPPIKLLDAMDQLGGNGGAYCYVYV
jgi:tyrosinase